MQSQRPTIRSRSQHDARRVVVVRFRSKFDDKTLTREFSDRREASRFAKQVGGRVYQ